MNKRTTRAIIKKLEASKAKIAKDRDELRDLLVDLSSIADDCDEAIDSLNYAVDALSRLV